MFASMKSRCQENESLCEDWDFDSTNLEVFVVEQGQCGVIELRVLPLPAVLLHEERRVFPVLVQFSERVDQSEGQALLLSWQRIVGLIDGQTRGGVGGARRGLVRGCSSTFL